MGFEECTNAKDKICIISRGETTFWRKATNCEDGGGIAVIVYNNNVEFPDEVISGSLGDTDSNGVKIPVLGTSLNTGLLLLDTLTQYEDGIFGNTLPTISLTADKAGYASFRGTSMATPHVAGAATKIWSARPDCTDLQIHEGIGIISIRLRSEGMGWDGMKGTVQTANAYQCMLDNFRISLRRRQRALAGSVSRFNVRPVIGTVSRSNILPVVGTVIGTDRLCDIE